MGLLTKLKELATMDVDQVFAAKRQLVGLDKAKSETVAKQELLIFLTPFIVKS